VKSSAKVVYYLERTKLFRPFFRMDCGAIIVW
jgi:hypothetical protein